MSGLVALVAWAALAGWIAAGVLLVLAHRRLERLEREHTARKWDLVALRAEVRALRRDAPRAGTTDAPAGTGPAADAPEGAAPEGTVPEGTVPAATGPRTLTGPTAWRRTHRPTGSRASHRTGSPRRRR
ncbi:hypothetical protein [Pseudonocardia spirodelae]|uniref:LapA family protein n=1 Tax=Pseudonocardia spirodelae TaxID=3133431 RepID=A0ABU8T5R6_9PSEU